MGCAFTELDMVMIPLGKLGTLGKLRYPKLYSHTRASQLRSHSASYQTTAKKQLPTVESMSRYSTVSSYRFKLLLVDVGDFSLFSGKMC